MAALHVRREMFEEIGVPYSAVADLRFLGITRELIRGGVPEFFYACTVDLPAENILNAHRRDKEGDRIALKFGVFGKALLDTEFPSTSPLDLFEILNVVAANRGRPAT